MKGYTLIEVVVALALLMIILPGGTALFFQSLRSTGLSDVDLNLNTSLQNVMSSIEKDIRYSRVAAVDLASRQSCISAGENGYLGQSLTIYDLNGLGTTYSLSADKIASVSALTNNVVYISPPDIKIVSLNFIWYCRGNVSDKIKIEIDASSVVLGSGVSVNRSISTEVNLLNSGIN